MGLETYDYVIVGAGTAGCLLANRLSRDPSKRVLLLEAGKQDNYLWIHIPVGYLYCIGNPRTDWLYRTTAEVGLNGRTLRYPRGKGLGGSSSINGMIYMRGQARDYDQWAQLTGDNEWCWPNVLPAFKAHEDHYRLDEGADPLNANAQRFSELHGHGGELRVEKQRLRWDVLEACVAAANEAGFQTTDDFNNGQNEGVAYFEVNQKAGWRWSSSRAFLRPIRHRKNLHVWTDAHVTKLLFDKLPSGITRCVGAQIHRGRESTSLYASRELILSAGAVGTPQLLQLSGIGDATLLHKCGIEVVQDSPGVGANLQDHLQIRTVFKVEGARTLNMLAGSLLGKISIGLEYLLKRSGPMSMSPSQLGAFTRSHPSSQFADLEYHIQPLSLEAFGEPLHAFPAITVSVCNLNPTSRGTVRIRPQNPEKEPEISPNYLSTEHDRSIAAQSLRQVRDIMAQPALAKYKPNEWKPGVQFQSDEELAKVAGDIASTIFHPVGTAKMGSDNDSMAVVDSRLRVRGVEDLRVVDASVMPLITSGNTNAPTLMIAEKASQWILGQ